jgi:hypothetical protein
VWLADAFPKTALSTCPGEAVLKVSNAQRQCKQETWPPDQVAWPADLLSHPVFKAKTKCSSYVCPGSSCHTYGQNVSTEYQCLYYIVSYYKNLLHVQNGLNNGKDPILPQAVDWGFRTPRRTLHQQTPHLLSSRT